MVYILVTRIGPCFLKRTGHMTISRFGPLLAIAGVACLLVWTPQGRAPQRVPTEADLGSGFRFCGSREAGSCPPVDLKSPSTVGAIRAIAPRLPEASGSNKEIKVQLAYADLEGAAPALGALSAVRPPAETAAFKPSAPPPVASAPALDTVLPPPAPDS